MTNFTGDGLQINQQDLSKLSLSSDDDGRMYHHNGNNPIELTGGTTIQTLGYYVWDNDASAWYPPFDDVDTLDGYDAGDFIINDGSSSMNGDLDFANYGIINLGSVSGGTGKIDLNTNHVKISSTTAGANLHFIDSNGLLIAEGIEGGDFNIPNGNLSENGNRVATRTWTNANADVPNADHADDANTLNGLGSSEFLQVSGDQMEGVLDLGGFDLNDGGTQKYDSTNGVFVQSALGGPAGSLSAYPLADSDLQSSFYTDSEAVSAIESASLSSNIDFGNNNLQNVSSIDSTNNDQAYIRTRGNGSDFWRFYDDANGQDIAQFREGGDVAIPNGGVVMGNFRVEENSNTNSLDFNYTG